MKKLILIKLLAIFLLAACQITGPAQDQWDQDEKKPRLLNDNHRTFTIGEKTQKKPTQ